MIARTLFGALVSFAAINSLPTRSASAYTPFDPKVVSMVDRGLVYLENADAQEYHYGTAGFAGGLGERALVAYTHFKVKHDPTAPVVQQGIAAARTMVGVIRSGKRNAPGISFEVYSTAVAVMLLAEVDKEKYKSELKTLQSFLYELQYPNGAFSYIGHKTGDISQTQYGVLAIWTLDHAGIPLDYKRVAACAKWLIRVQDPSGGWPYQAQDPGQGRPNMRQTDVYPAMAYAGGSSILIAGDALRLWGDAARTDMSAFPGAPKAIKLYVPDENAERRRGVTVSDDKVLNAIKASDQYLASNEYKRKAKDYYYYQLYTQERYESFKEIALGNKPDESPSWYNQGVEALMGYQDPKTGGWGVEDADHSGPVAGTCFAILFLIRSTQRSIAAASTGSLAGGQGLPKDTTKIRREGAQIKGEPVGQSVVDLLSALEDDGNSALEGKSLPEDMQLATDPKERRAQLDRLERLVRGSQSYQARRVAARLLGKSDEMRVVPALIFALSDPDTSVQRYARDGLRFISRKFEGFGMPNKPTDVELRQAEKAWKEWYLTVNPKHLFVDD
ncbi:hypothetical protein [Rhodopirellula halodulae]|uniref:hypothetical protein n=1 Tax=Rhodopirellula halodulae TaxID=2894198 RepID=UPI001E61AB65|nr:hypothetical protein [Rhodopirellula sp. JC737]MCC9654237.1 hypothetical protein [Rhodopirellula sp. JC737]